MKETCNALSVFESKNLQQKFQIKMNLNVVPIHLQSVKKPLLNSSCSCAVFLCLVNFICAKLIKNRKTCLFRTEIQLKLFTPQSRSGHKHHFYIYLFV